MTSSFSLVHLAALPRQTIAPAMLWSKKVGFPTSVGYAFFFNPYHLMDDYQLLWEYQPFFDHGHKFKCLSAGSSKCVSLFSSMFVGSIRQNVA
jgi:hypothetical protein